jgi:hypothetical protein
MAVDLAELALKHGTDKGTTPVERKRLFGRTSTLSAKGYTDTYARFFEALRDKPITLLEIGIDRGASVAMWEDYFTQASLHAIDIKQGCRKYATPRTSVYIGSQTDPGFLESVAASSGPLDIVIDDGGHTMEQHDVSLTTLWKHVKPGGIYVIEDMHTAYWKKFGGGGDDSTMERLKRQLDTLMTGEGDAMVDGIAGVWFARSVAVLFKEG